MKVYRLMNRNNYMMGVIDYHANKLTPEVQSMFDAGAIYCSHSADAGLEWLDMDDSWDNAELYELTIKDDAEVLHYDGWYYTSNKITNPMQAEVWSRTEHTWYLDLLMSQIIVKLEDVIDVKKIA